MNKTIKQIICILLLLMCLLPLAVFVIAGPSASGANERLAAKPRLTAGGRLNFDVLSDTADYFDGHFGLRQELITANAAADAAIFRESATPEVLLGTDGWLYYADTLADYTGADPMTERQLWCAARNLALMQEYAQSQGADFLFVCAPNKNTLYPAHMPVRYVRAGESSDLDRLEALLDAQGVAFCDVRQTLLGAGEAAYYRTDSHWNGYGSALACDVILSALGRDSALAEEDFSPNRTAATCIRCSIRPPKSRSRDSALRGSGRFSMWAQCTAQTISLSAQNPAAAARCWPSGTRSATRCTRIWPRHSHQLCSPALCHTTCL